MKYINTILIFIFALINSVDAQTQIPSDLLYRLSASRPVASGAVSAPLPLIWWQMNYNAGYYPDLSTNHNDMLPTKTGNTNIAPAGATAGSRSISLGGNAEYLASEYNASAALTNTSDRTIMSWEKFAVAGTDNRSMAGLSTFQLFAWAGGDKTYGLYDYIGTPYGSGVARVTNWMHHAVTLDGVGTNLTIWINATNKASYKTAFKTAASKVLVGESGYSFTGLISETVFYSRALSASEMTNAYNGSLASDYLYRYNWSTLVTNYIADTGSGITNNLNRMPAISTGPTYQYAGVVSNSFSFDGVNDYLESNPTYTVSNWSVSICFYQTNLQGNVSLFSVGDSTSRFFQVDINSGSGFTNAAMFYTFSNESTYAGATYPTNTIGTNTLNAWNHLFVDYSTDRSPMGKLYFNGVYVTPMVSSFYSILPRPVSRMRIGTAAVASPANYFKGSVSDFRFWTNLLSDAEITSVYNARRQ